MTNFIKCKLGYVLAHVCRHIYLSMLFYVFDGRCKVEVY